MGRAGLICGLVASVAAATGAMGQATLKVGVPAPPLKVAEWVKGDPVPAFEADKVYVVEFWATWCGPCRVSIPHLTEMAKTFKDKVTFVGVSVWERGNGAGDTSYYATVKDFVKSMGEKMDYNVAVDGPEGTMANTWMKAGGQDGIPAAFVVGQDGNIAWIGHPMDGLDKVLTQVVAGTFDPKAAAAEREKREAAQAKMAGLVGPVRQAAMKGDWAKATALLDKVLLKNPDMEETLAQYKASLLMRSSEKRLYAYLKKLSASTWKDDAQNLNMAAWMIVDPDSPLKARNYDVALSIAQRASSLTQGKDPMILDTLAAAHFGKGQVARAIEVQQKAVDLYSAAPGDPTKKQMEERLAVYKKKAPK